MDVDDVLVLQAVVFGEEEILAAAERRRVLGIVVELLKACFYLGAIGNFFKIAEGNLVFGLDPFGGFGGVVVFQPTIRIGDFDAEVVVNLIILARLGVVEQLRVQNCGEQEAAQSRQDKAEVRQEMTKHH